MKFSQNLFANYRVIKNTAYVVIKDDAYILDEVGQLVWKLIGDGNTLQNVVREVTETYSDSGDNINNIEMDVKQFIEELLKNKLIEEIL
ncbi:PqqD family protein [Bacillus subtilis]|uniref:PqqD family protein n=1 Tax=Bacillus TaxID=1386 RepID=UPI001E59A6CE|nr:PqqD family protein [Bacillus subtilis]MED4518483.1 PqqD family protein [Bacillus subtilis]